MVVSRRRDRASEVSGGGGGGGGGKRLTGFSVLEAKADGDGAAPNADEEEDELEQQLSLAHSTASTRKAHKKLKRLTVEEIDSMKLKPLRRALEERGELNDSWAGGECGLRYRPLRRLSVSPLCSASRLPSHLLGATCIRYATAT